MIEQNEISNLIKEAKPLYFREKRNKRNAKIVLSFFFSMFLFMGGTWTAIDVKSSSIVAQYQVSSVEEMGFAVDEYGFLMVE